ncbi:MAG TPA: thioredoxin family protein [Polyangiaceae bacterium]
MTTEPSRTEIERSTGAVMLEFGASWCSICHAARPHIDQALRDHPGVEHVRIEDGKGKPLGRSFGIKLWPTLVFLRDGKEVHRVVRPRGAEELEQAFERCFAGFLSRSAETGH